MRAACFRVVVRALVLMISFKGLFGSRVVVRPFVVRRRRLEPPRTRQARVSYRAGSRHASRLWGLGRRLWELAMGAMARELAMGAGPFLPTPDSPGPLAPAPIACVSCRAGSRQGARAVRGGGGRARVSCRVRHGHGRRAACSRVVVRRRRLDASGTSGT